MAVVTIQGIAITYRLAAGVESAKTFVANMRFGTWSGDMGDRFHQWNNGIPANGRRRGDHTAWSSDGPAGVVKAFDWKPPDPAHFKAWILPQLRAGRYRSVLKFMNLLGRQYGPMGGDQGPNSDTHCHWSYQPGAVNSAVNPIQDYYREAIQEDDVTPADIEAIRKAVVTSLLATPVALMPEMTGGQQAAPLGAAIGATLSRVCAVQKSQTGEEIRDAVLLAEVDNVEELAAAAGGDPVKMAEALAAKLGPQLTGQLVDALNRARIVVAPPAS